MRGARVYGGLALGLMLLASGVCAQAQQQGERMAGSGGDASVYRIVYLTHMTRQHQALDLVTDLRNMLPKALMYYVGSQSAISIRGSAEDIAEAQKIIADLDRPTKVYRLTYTITETDGGKRIGTQHFALIAVDGEKAVLKQGSRVPIVTGKSDAGHGAVGTQMQYVDVGLNIDATVQGTTLLSKVEQSSIAEAKPSGSAQDPVIRQTTLQASSPLAAGQAVVLGSLDVPGSTRHLEIAVTAELTQ